MPENTDKNQTIKTRVTFAYGTARQIVVPVTIANPVGKVVTVNNAILDTGASCTSVSLRFLSELRMSPQGTSRPTDTASGRVMTDQYLVKVGFAQFDKGHIILARNLPGTYVGAAGVLIGMDIISFYDIQILRSGVVTITA